MTAADPGLTLDHVVIGVDDLDGAARELTSVLGRSPSWRGRHPTYGTANVLYRLGAGYLELLSPEPGANISTPWTDGLNAFLAEHGDGLFALALQTPDVETTTALVRARGQPVEQAAEGAGVDLVSGAERRWSNARIPAESSRGTRAFFIEHRSPPETLPEAPLVADSAVAVTRVLGLTIESAEAEAARRFWRELVGLPESPHDDGWRYAMGDAALLLYAGVGDGPIPDRWVRLLLGAGNLSRLADRLDRDGRRFEQGDFREGYGLRLDVCGVDALIMEASQ